MESMGGTDYSAMPCSLHFCLLVGSGLLWWVGWLPSSKKIIYFYPTTQSKINGYAASKLLRIYFRLCLIIIFKFVKKVCCFQTINWHHIILIRVGVLEDTFRSPWPWPRSLKSWPWPRSLKSLAWARSLKSPKIALSSARGQHYFLNSWNFVGKLQKPRGKFANTFFIFLNWSIGVGKGREAAPP